MDNKDREEDIPQGDLFGDNEVFETAEPARLPKVKPMPVTSRDVSKDATPPAYAARPEDLADTALLAEIEEADSDPEADFSALNAWEAEEFLPSIMQRWEKLPEGISNFLTPKQRACVLRIYRKVCR